MIGNKFGHIYKIGILFNYVKITSFFNHHIYIHSNVLYHLLYTISYTIQ